VGPIDHHRDHDPPDPARSLFLTLFMTSLFSVFAFFSFFFFGPVYLGLDVMRSLPSIPEHGGCNRVHALLFKLCWVTGHVTACQSVAVTGRGDGPRLVESGRELWPAGNSSQSPRDAPLPSYWRCTQQVSTTIWISHCCQMLQLVFYFEHRQYPVPDCNPHAHTLSQVQWYTAPLPPRRHAFNCCSNVILPQALAMALNLSYIATGTWPLLLLESFAVADRSQLL
jgi:hypothetical protein